MFWRAPSRAWLVSGCALFTTWFSLLSPAYKRDARAEPAQRTEHGEHGERAPVSASKPQPSRTAPASPGAPTLVERRDSAMGTSLHFIAYTNASVDSARAQVAFEAAITEIRRLESILSEWRDDSEVGRINVHAGEWVDVGPETKAVIEKSLWIGRASQGTFDITFQAMSGVWRFGSAQSEKPTLPSAQEVKRLRALIDYRKVELDSKNSRVRIPKGRKIGLGGIAKGYIVDRAVDVLRRAGLSAFLVQAGGDLYGAGRKPDGSPWLSGIQDPRGPRGTFFATLELEDHAFSTAGDYERAFILDGKRYHHIIDPRTGYPATHSRSVTVHAPDATTADMVDDAVFILGPEKGLKLADSLPGVGVVIVDEHNQVWVSPTLQSKLRLQRAPSDGL